MCDATVTGLALRWLCLSLAVTGAMALASSTAPFNQDSLRVIECPQHDERGLAYASHPLPGGCGILAASAGMVIKLLSVHPLHSNAATLLSGGRDTATQRFMYRMVLTDDNATRIDRMLRGVRVANGTIATRASIELRLAAEGHVHARLTPSSAPAWLRIVRMDGHFAALVLQTPHDSAANTGYSVLGVHNNTDGYGDPRALFHPDGFKMATATLDALGTPRLLVQTALHGTTTLVGDLYLQCSNCTHIVMSELLAAPQPGRYYFYYSGTRYDAARADGTGLFGPLYDFNHQGDRWLWHGAAASTGGLDGRHGSTWFVAAPIAWARTPAECFARGAASHAALGALRAPPSVSVVDQRNADGVGVTFTVRVQANFFRVAFASYEPPANSVGMLESFGCPAGTTAASFWDRATCGIATWHESDCAVSATLNTSTSPRCTSTPTSTGTRHTCETLVCYVAAYNEKENLVAACSMLQLRADVHDGNVTAAANVLGFSCKPTGVYMTCTGSSEANLLDGVRIVSSTPAVVNTSAAPDIDGANFRVLFVPGVPAGVSAQLTIIATRRTTVCMGGEQCDDDAVVNTTVVTPARQLFVYAYDTMFVETLCAVGQTLVTGWQEPTTLIIGTHNAVVARVRAVNLSSMTDATVAPVNILVQGNFRLACTLRGAAINVRNPFTLGVTDRVECELYVGDGANAEPRYLFYPFVRVVVDMAYELVLSNPQHGTLPFASRRQTNGSASGTVMNVEVVEAPVVTAASTEQPTASQNGGAGADMPTVVAIAVGCVVAGGVLVATGMFLLRRLGTTDGHDRPDGNTLEAVVPGYGDDAAAAVHDGPYAAGNADDDDGENGAYAADAADAAADGDDAQVITVHVQV